ncbi:hypothetical protein [Paenibacillus piri]|uniref:Aerobactin siderophore biosynthesis IucA/IucC-like C-terminal domain-containing protein n=1 Tax=Paenibacillus piri TaxID=2547395 RepID=A0A4R5KK88_9BACL|nr:hypothetical protein [Paenibacillus piri]TDF95961.1 hypothetical protein E1757_19795 [Paenibacillus piri]
MHNVTYPAWAARYGISFTEPEAGTVLALRDLMNDDAFFPFIHSFADDLSAPALQVAGSLFFKRYCLIIAGALHGYIHCRKAIDLSPELVKLVWNDNALRLAAARAEEPSWLGGLQGDERRRTVYFDRLIADQVCPMLRRVVELTRAGEDTLWATLSYSLAYWKNEWLHNDALTEADRGRIEDDFAELLGTFSQERYPGLDRFPLITDFRQADNTLDPEKPILIRAKCCLFYCLPGKDRHCYTCPRITEEMRMKRYSEVHAK